MKRPGFSGTVGLRRWGKMCFIAATVAGNAACSKAALERIPPPITTVDDELAVRGQVCTSPPGDVTFPVKILFLVDTSGSMIVTDPADVRVTGINAVIQQYMGLPGIQFDVIGFNSKITDVFGGFTSAPDLSKIDSVIKIADNLTDTQGVLGAAYETLSADMLMSSPAERARSKYIIIFFTDGIPDPLCSADNTPCGSMTCKPHTHCDPLTILSASQKDQETYSCDPDYSICTVPKKDWSTAFSIPKPDPNDYPDLQNGANYNTTPQILASVHQIMELQKQYHVGSITLNTNFLFPVAAIGSPLAAPFGLDRVAGETLLTAMASAGSGTFQEFTDDTQINFLNVSFASLQVKNEIVQSYVASQVSDETGTALVLDTDGDGLPDSEEQTLGTCAATSATCLTPWDSDGDGYSDFIEVQNKASGFDPLDKTKPPTPCLSIGLDSDGDGLTDCEEAFLGTSPGNVDTDGDLLSDFQEVRNGLNPLDPTDANGDINRDNILNEEEVKMGLSPTAQVSPSEKAFAFRYNFDAIPSTSATSGTCYNFLVQHIRLLTPPATLKTPLGFNRVYYDVFETALDMTTNFSTVRRACADVLYINGKVKVPLSGSVTFADSDFVDLRTFELNPDAYCKDLTKDVFDAGADAARTADGGTD